MRPGELRAPQVARGEGDAEAKRELLWGFRVALGGCAVSDPAVEISALIARRRGSAIRADLSFHL